MAKNKSNGLARKSHENETWREISAEVDRGFRGFFMDRDMRLPFVSLNVPEPSLGNPHDAEDLAAELFPTLTIA